LADAPGNSPDLILIASGSELSVAVEAHARLLAEGFRSRVVSMPSWDIFEHQTEDYRDSVLPSNVTARIAIEQASTFGWERYVGATGRVIGMHTFGASAPLKELQKKFGFEPDAVVTIAKELLTAVGVAEGARLPGPSSAKAGHSVRAAPADPSLIPKGTIAAKNQL